MERVTYRCLASALFLGVLSAGFSVRAADPTSAAPAPGSPKRFVVVLAGFFNSEDSTTLSPEPIVYAGMDLQAVYEHITSLARQYAPTKNREILTPEKAQAFQGAQLHGKDRETILDRVEAIFTVLDEVNQEDARAGDHVKILRGPFPPSPDFGEDDVMLFVVGLESPRHGGDPHALRSSLGAFWFRGDGTNVGAMIAPYDFSKLNTESMKALVARAFPKAGTPETAASPQADPTKFGP